MDLHAAADEDERPEMALIGLAADVRRLAELASELPYRITVQSELDAQLDPRRWAAAIVVEGNDPAAARATVQSILQRRRDLPLLAVLRHATAESIRASVEAGALDTVDERLLDERELALAVARLRAHAHVRHEHERRRNDLRRSVTTLESRNQRLLESIAHLETLVRTDELTGLANRRWLNLVLEGAWAEASRNGLPLAVLMIDLNQFKLVNDLLGHACGDEVLQLAARVIRANSRDVDTTARLGGDEFCILLPHTRLEDAERVARRLAAEFAHAVSGGLVPPGVGMAIGLAHNEQGRPPNAGALLGRADSALYWAKSSGTPVVTWDGSEVAADPALRARRSGGRDVRSPAAPRAGAGHGSPASSRSPHGSPRS